MIVLYFSHSNRGSRTAVEGDEGTGQGGAGGGGRRGGHLHCGQDDRGRHFPRVVHKIKMLLLASKFRSVWCLVLVCQ